MQKIYAEDDANYPRLAHDKLFIRFDAEYKYTGYIDRLIRFIEKIQLKDKALWKLFVNQFRGTPDDEDSGWRCEYFGKMMRGACFVYSYTKDKELYSIITEEIEEILATEDKNGRIATYSSEKEFNGWDLWGRKYVLLSMQYFLEICKDGELAEKVKVSMMRQADYIISKIGSEDGKKNITLATSHWDGLNSSSILEPFVRLYTITKEKRYLDFAAYIIDNGGIEHGNLVELAIEGSVYPYEYPITKAYEMMSFFEGILEYYRVTGIEKYRVAVENFAALVAESDITVIGCAGTSHELFDNSKVHQTDPTRLLVMQETCVTVTWMKLCFQLLLLTGKAEYAERIETSALNALFGAVNTAETKNNNGMPFDSYSPLLANKRGRKTAGRRIMEGGVLYGCCAAIGACGMGLVPKCSTLAREDGISVQLYIPGQVKTFSPTNNPVLLDIDTSYPKGSKILIKLHLEKAESFVLSLRIPSWSAENKLIVNGEEISAEIGNYAEIRREWKDGDSVLLEFDMRTRMIAQDGYVSFSRGPLVLAEDARCVRSMEEKISPVLSEDGYVKCSLSSEAPFETVVEEKIELREGKPLLLVDYSSAGKTWDDDSMTAAWIPLN